MTECSLSEVTLSSYQAQCSLYLQCRMQPGIILCVLWETPSPNDWLKGTCDASYCKNSVCCALGCWLLSLSYFPLLTNADITSYVTRLLFIRALCFGHIALLVKWLFLSGFEFQLALETHLNASFPPPQEPSQIFLSLHCPL